MYQERALGELFRIKHGYAFKGEHFAESGEFLLLTPGNFNPSGGLKLKGDKEKFYTGEIPDTFILSQGDLIIAMTDLTQNAPILGAPAFIPASGQFLHNQRLGKIVEIKRQHLDSRFLYYLFNTVGVRAQIKATASGATVKHTAPDRIYAVKAPIPEVPTQRRIATILSAYDNLVENNNKRITLLQQQTDLIFTHFEQMSCSSAKQRKLGDMADAADGTIRTGPFGSQLHESDYTTEGTPVIMPKNLRDGRIDTGDIARIPDEIVERVAQHKLSVGDIVYGRRGDIGRRAFIRRGQAGWLCGTGCLRISLQGGALHPRYLHQYLGKPDVVALIAGRAIGATMPNLNTSILRDIPVDVPPLALQEKFTRFADANDELIDVLVEKNALLRGQRDLLLPRLLSGEIDVSSLPIPGEKG